jgi:hypothetical protein
MLCYAAAMGQHCHLTQETCRDDGRHCIKRNERGIVGPNVNEIFTCQKRERPASTCDLSVTVIWLHWCHLCAHVSDIVTLHARTPDCSQYEASCFRRIRDIHKFLIIVEDMDRLCGLVVRVLGYRSGGRGSIPGTTRFSERKKKRKTVVGLERGPLNLVSTTDELLGRKVAAPV